MYIAKDKKNISIQVNLLYVIASQENISARDVQQLNTLEIQ